MYFSWYLVDSCLRFSRLKLRTNFSYMISVALFIDGHIKTSCHIQALVKWLPLLFNKVWTQVMRRFKSYQCFRGFQCEEPLTKRFSSIKHFLKTIHYLSSSSFHLLQHQNNPALRTWLIKVLDIAARGCLLLLLAIN